jgi:GDP/UDP-N,N'-diacetylbacillosamine 2-epimerase (hydrolysing)
MIRIGVLTSSRADFGIYLPLLKLMKEDVNIKFSLIIFGTHLSRFHGYTIDQIKELNFEVDYTVDSLLLGDTPEANSTSTGLTYLKFSSFWDRYSKEFDVVFCLGDRFEMFAAVYAGIPFGIKYAHIHGGETTLGAIDNIYRHAITLASTYHFTATDIFSGRVIEIIGSNLHVQTVGALSLQNIFNIELLSIEEFKFKWEIDISIPTILVTFHPETVAINEIEYQSNIFLESIKSMAKRYQILLTLPNTDTYGSILRQKIHESLTQIKNVHIYENLGTRSYFTAMKYCLFIYGNSSSGIIEAASFNKYVIDIGKRQEGRLTSGNVFNVEFNIEDIENKINFISSKNFYYSGTNLYYKSNGAENILSAIKKNAK